MLRHAARRKERKQVPAGAGKIMNTKGFVERTWELKSEAEKKVFWQKKLKKYSSGHAGGRSLNFLTILHKEMDQLSRKLIKAKSYTFSIRVRKILHLKVKLKPNGPRKEGKSSTFLCKEGCVQAEAALDRSL